MKKAFLSVLFTLLLCPFAFSQDIITTKNGDEINAKVLEITPDEVKYTTAEKAGVLQSVPKEQIFMIKYESGQKDVFNAPAQAQELTSAPALNQTPSASPAFKETYNNIKSDRVEGENLYIKGRNDAALYYRDYKTAGTLTLVSTLLFPPAGLITAIGTSVTTPGRNNLDYPDANLYAHADYARGYKAKAKRVKSGKVWKNFGIGFGSLVLLNFLVASNQ